MDIDIYDSLHADFHMLSTYIYCTADLLFSSNGRIARSKPTGYLSGGQLPQGTTVLRRVPYDVLPRDMYFALGVYYNTPFPLYIIFIMEVWYESLVNPTPSLYLSSNEFELGVGVVGMEVFHVWVESK